MYRVLCVYSSPRGERSRSIAICEAFLKTYGELHPEDEIDRLDLFGGDLPPFAGPALQAKYDILHDQPYSEEQSEAWKAIEEIIERFTTADKYVFAVPMWNFGIPYRLKHYFDILVQPGYTFSYSPEEGYSGLVTGKPVFLAYARGGEYDEAAAQSVDMQKRYMELILGFIGLTDFRSVIVQPTIAGGPDVTQARMIAAVARAEEMATDF